VDETATGSLNFFLSGTGARSALGNVALAKIKVRNLRTMPFAAA
jgi:hypothetical protein